MVKNLVGGMLKKGEEKKEDVPDELPPLNSEEKTEQQAPPDELPALDAAPSNPPPAQSTAKPPMPQPVEHREQPAPMREEEQEPDPHDDHQNDDGFFPKLHDLLKTSKDESILNQNLLSTMKESYSIRKESAKTGMGAGEEKRLKSDIEEVLSTLKLLEGKWRAQRLVLDEDERQLKSYEKDISEKEQALKKLLKHYSIYETKPGVRLVLKNYLEIRNISELYNALRLLDQVTFSKHVGKGRNDFATFLSHFDTRLAAKVKKARTKKSMLAVIERAIKGSREEK